MMHITAQSNLEPANSLSIHSHHFELAYGRKLKSLKMVEETKLTVTAGALDKKARKKRKKLACKQDKDPTSKKQRKKEKRRDKEKKEKNNTKINTSSATALPTTKSKKNHTSAPAKKVSLKTNKEASTKKKAQAEPNQKSTHEQKAKAIPNPKKPAPKTMNAVPATVPQLQSSNAAAEIRTETIGLAKDAMPRVDAKAQTDVTNPSNATDQALPTLLDLLLQKKLFQKEQYQRKLCHVEKEIQQITRLQDKERNPHVTTALVTKPFIASARMPNVAIQILPNGSTGSEKIIPNANKIDGEEFNANANDFFGSSLSASTQALTDSEEDVLQETFATEKKLSPATMQIPQKSLGDKPLEEKKISLAKQRKDPPQSKQQRKATEFPDFPHNEDYELPPEMYKLDPNESSIDDDSRDSDFEQVVEA